MYILGGAVLLVLLHPSITCVRIAWRLLWAERVVIAEHGSWQLNPESLLTEVTLKRSQVIGLAFLFCGPRGLPAYPRCIFMPHHVIRMYSRTGSCHVGQVCLTCRQIMLNPEGRPSNWVGDLGLRARAIEGWLRRHGIPVRLEFYKQYEGEQAETQKLAASAPQ